MDQQQQQAGAPVAVAAAPTPDNSTNNAVGGTTNHQQQGANMVSAPQAPMPPGPIYPQQSTSQQQQQFMNQMFAAADPSSFAAAAAAGSPLFPAPMFPLMGLPPNMLNTAPPPQPAATPTGESNNTSQGEISTNNGGATTSGGGNNLPGSTYSNGFAIPGLQLGALQNNAATPTGFSSVHAAPQFAPAPVVSVAPPVDNSQQQQQQQNTSHQSVAQAQTAAAPTAPQNSFTSFQIPSETNTAQQAQSSNGMTMQQQQQQQHQSNLSPRIQPQIAPIAPASTTNNNTQTSSASATQQTTATQVTSSTTTIKQGTTKGNKRSASTAHLSPSERAKQNRDRNREHARSTRLRKKAYVNQLKEMYRGLEAERAEEQHKRRVAIEKLEEIQSVRKGVVRDFFRMHSGFECDPRKWNMVLEEDVFWLKQPLTPYRYYRRTEKEQESIRISRGVKAIIRDAASMSVMVEEIGSRSARWMQIKREDFLIRQQCKHNGSSQPSLTTTTGCSRVNSNGNGQHMPHSIVRQNSRLQHAVSSLSSSSGSSTGNGSGGEEDRQLAHQRRQQQQVLLQGGQNVAQAGGMAKKLSDKASSKNAQQHGVTIAGGATNSASVGNKVSSSSSSSDSRSKQQTTTTQQQQQPSSSNNNDFHDYHAPSLPDPMLDSSGGSSTGSDSPTESRTDHPHVVAGTKHVCTDSSSGDEDKPVMMKASTKKRKLSPSNAQVQQATAAATAMEPMDISGNNMTGTTAATSIKLPQTSGLPPNIARSGGISHNIRSVAGILPTATTATTAPKASSSCINNGNARLSVAPAISLPPFVGIGKRVAPTTVVGAAIMSNSKSNMAAAATGVANPLAAANAPSTTTTGTKNPSLVVSSIKTAAANGGGPTIIPTRDSSSSRGTGIGSNNSGLSTVSTTAGGTGAVLVSATVDNDTASSTQSSSQQNLPQIQAYYHVNEDDMIIMDDVLMCPFIFRSQDAVLCGALAECIMPGMLRAHFSSRNKLLSLEMVYDSMGFMQQLERASCTEDNPQVIPNSLEMALSPNTNEARVITLAKPPFLIVSVNEAWTRTTKYTQMEVEGKEMSVLHGKKTDADVGKRAGKPIHEMAEVARGNCACSVNFHYDKHGREFVDFVCSYPLTNANDEITHILHICKELPEPSTPESVFPDAPSTNGSVSFQEQ